MANLGRFAARAVLLLACIALTTRAEAKTIGLFKDARTGIGSGLTNTLDKAGWDVIWFSAGDLENAQKLAKTDVMFFGGGWGRYFFPSAKARLNIIRYVASGKGALVAGFRSGYVRTANRPMFPEIGEVYNRVQSAWINPEGNSPLAKAFKGKTVAFGGHDHLCIRVGEQGEQFCSCAGDPVGAFGDYFCGRVVVFGAHFSYQMVDETREPAERLFLACLKYLTGQSAPSEGEAAIAMRKAESQFIRRELGWTYCIDDRGPDRRPGILPEWRDRTTSEPDALAYKLEYYATFLAKLDADKCRNMAKRLKTATDNVRRKTDEQMKAVKASVAKMDIGDLAIKYVTGSAFFDLEKFKSTIKGLVRDSELAAARKLIDEMRPKVKAAKAAALAKEIAEDLKLVPGLVEKLSTSKCPKARYDAALELGRISPDDKAAVEALVKAIDDEDEKVRVQAIISLGWMQAKGAVDALVKTASTSKCPFMRRRAIQALGLIGDQKAIPAVMKALDDADERAARCAIIALGHLKATAAVERLLEIAENDKEKKPNRTAAIIALGDIGDARAKERLEKIEEAAKDIVKSRRGGHPLTNYLSDSSSIGIKISSGIALKRLAEGGRKSPGVKQPEEYRSKDSFYAITGRFNAFAGRTETVRGPFEGINQKFLWAHVKDAGFTGIHNAWGWAGWNPEKFSEVVREADDLGLLWIDVMPGRWVYCDYASMEANFLEFDDVPAYRGVWAEETWPEMGGNRAEFKAFLAERYGKDWAKTLKLSDAEVKEIDNLADWIAFGTKGPDKPLEKGFAPPWDGALRTLIIEFNAMLLEKGWHESQEYLHARRKGFAQTFVISTADPIKFVGGMQAVERLDSLGHESYECFGRGSSFFMERYRNGGAARSVMSEQYHWYCPSNAHALRGFWQNAMHSKCYYDFALHQMFEQPSWYDNWSWERGRWAAAKEVFTRIAKTPDLYAIAPSAANAAVVLSERSSSAVKEQVYFQCSIPVRSDHNIMAAWTALNQLQVPTDIVWAETLDRQRLSKYKFLYLPTSKFLAEKEIGLIREWVKEGGVLVAEGNTSLFGEYSLKNRGNYALADVFGCDWKDTVFRKDGDSDTYATRHGSRVSAYKVIPSIDNLVHIDDSIHRDVKPEKSIVLAKVAADAGEFLPGLEKGAEIEMDGALGCDVVKPTTAKVVAVFKKGGEPAILANEFGKGRCYFIAANYFAHAHVTSRWEMMPGRLDFWQNVVELFGSMSKAGYAKTGATPPVEISGVSREVEVTVDDQGSRYVVQMLDYDVKSEGVKGAKLFVPGERKIKKVYYPGAKEPLKLDGRAAALRDFSVYDMFVVEFED